MSGKGSNRRREDTAAVEANWDRIFSGRGRTVKAAGSNPATNAGSNPAVPASYIDNANGAAVTAEWWPGDHMETNDAR